MIAGYKPSVSLLLAFILFLYQEGIDHEYFYFYFIAQN